MSETIHELVNLSTIIQSGCDHYVPSEKAIFLYKYGYGYYGIGDSEFIYKIDAVIQCIRQPYILTHNLEELYKKQNDEQILEELYLFLNDQYPTVFSNSTPNGESSSLALVNPPFEKYGLVVRNSEMNHIDINKTIKQLEIITKFNQNEFKNYILDSMKRDSGISPQPPVNAYLSSVTTFIHDLYMVVTKEMGPFEFTPSLSIENAILYSIQDNIKMTLRHMEDVQMQTKRTIQDKITETVRLTGEIILLPRILYTLFIVNSIAFFIILHFFNKIKGSSNTKYLAIESSGSQNHVLEYEHYLEGGKKYKRQRNYNFRNLHQ
jgi:hypothetical protein